MLDEDGNPIQQPPGALNTLQKPANPYGLAGPYAAIADQMQQQYAAQNAAKQQYLDSLQKRETDLKSQGMSDYDKAGALFQLSGALLSPTKSGGIGGTLESFGAGATALAGPMSKAGEAQRQRQQQIQQLQDARAKMGVEMAGGMDPQGTLSLMKAQQDAQPKLSASERMMNDLSLTEDERKLARLQALGIAPTPDKDEVKNVYINGQQTSVIMRGGKPFDLATGQPLDPAKLAAAAEPKPEVKNVFVNGRQVSVVMRGDKAFDLATGQPLDPSKLVAPEEDKADIKNIIVNGNTVSVRYINGKPVDPITGEPFDPAKIAAASQTAEMSERKAAALSAGIPLPEIDPANTISDPKVKERFRAQQATAANAFLNKEEEKLPTTKLQQDSSNAKRFLELNSERQRQTGPVMGRLWSLSPANQEMKALSIQISRGMRQTGEGSMSDYDAQQFAKASIGTGTDYSTNYNLGTAYVKAKELEQDRREFFRSYAGLNGTIQDAQKHWNKYLKDNPIFDSSKGVQQDATKLRLNNNRMEYQDYFKKQMGPRNFERDQNGRLILQQGQ